MRLRIGPERPEVVAVCEPDSQAARLSADGALVVFDGIDALLEVGGISNGLVEIIEPVVLAYWIGHCGRERAAKSQRITLFARLERLRKAVVLAAHGKVEKK